MNKKFIPRSIFPDYNISLSHFKGHQQKALVKLGHLMPQIDLLLEIRDSRAPISTINQLFNKISPNKQKLILYSKKDLSILNKSLLDKWHSFRNEQYMFVDCRSKNDSKRIIKTITNLYNSMESPPPLGLRLMIIGFPNVGKSTLVNTLRNVGLNNNQFRKVARTGGAPGITKSTSEIIRISHDPEIMIYDTPGIFIPSVKDIDTMLSLSLVGCISESFIDPVIQADYLLYLLNLQDESGCKYNEYLSYPTNDIYELLYNIAKSRGGLKKDGTYDELGTALHWLNLWKQGKSNQYKGVFDISVIKEMNTQDLKKINDDEIERLNETKVSQRLDKSFGGDKRRNRTAKDRQYDMRNRLFKL
ncbi:unnamed protein product [Candida verbasci]|uniref:G domain-containing protein n=1 Tax=Candida verbasci TaxID=1227364 RepID=A0A9W4TTE4_9ASCO|nr:unnamed protein product [Candida verbasci]